MPTPVLKLRKDIWTYFPVNVDPMGRGANGADRHCIEWHNGKVRQMALAAGKSDAEMKTTLLPQLLHALSKSNAWTVEAPPPGSKCAAILVMKFLPRNQTRNQRNQIRNQTRNRNNARIVRKWNQTRKSPAKPKSATKTHKSANKPKTPNTTRKDTKNHSALEGDALIRKARALLNLMSASTVERLSHEFATLRPKTLGEFEELCKVITDIAMDQQAYHPLIVHLLHVLDAAHEVRPYAEKPSKVVADRILSRAMEEPVFAKMEVASEEENAPVAKNFEDQLKLQKRFFRSVMLFAGFLYRDGFLTWASYKPLLRHFGAMALEIDTDELDYRIYDGYAQGLMYTLIRSGARMIAEGGEAAETFKSLVTGIRRLSKEAKRGFVRTDALEFVESVADGFKIKAGMTWTIGAPMSDVKVRRTSVAAPAAPAAPAAAMGLGVDIGELWRRFPLDVKQEGVVYIVRFHNKKLRERYEKEQGKYRSFADFETALSRHILQLIDHSAHWRRGPAMPGTLVTVVRK